MDRTVIRGGYALAHEVSPLSLSLSCNTHNLNLEIGIPKSVVYLPLGTLGQLFFTSAGILSSSRQS